MEALRLENLLCKVTCSCNTAISWPRLLATLHHPPQPPSLPPIRQQPVWLCFWLCQRLLLTLGCHAHCGLLWFPGFVYRAILGGSAWVSFWLRIPTPLIYMGGSQGSLACGWVKMKWREVTQEQWKSDLRRSNGRVISMRNGRRRRKPCVPSIFPRPYQWKPKVAATEIRQQQEFKQFHHHHHHHQRRQWG